MPKSEAARLWKGFWQLAGPKIRITSTVPMLVGGAYAYSSGQFDIYWFFISLAAVYLIDTGRNAVNEITDGKKTIAGRRLTGVETAFIAAGVLGGAGTIGLYIMIFREFSIFWIGFAGVVLSVFYRLPPVKLACRRFGKAAVGFTSGPMVMMAIFLIMTHGMNAGVVLMALPIGFLAANVVWMGQFAGYKEGLEEKRTVLVPGLLFVLAFASTAILAISFKNPIWLLGFAGIPTALKAVKNAKTAFNDTQALARSNAGTILAYQITGAAMLIGAVSEKFI